MKKCITVAVGLAAVIVGNSLAIGAGSAVASTTAGGQARNGSTTGGAHPVTSQRRGQ